MEPAAVGTAGTSTAPAHRGRRAEGRALAGGDGPDAALEAGRGADDVSAQRGWSSLPGVHLAACAAAPSQPRTVLRMPVWSSPRLRAQPFRPACLSHPSPSRPHHPCPHPLTPETSSSPTSASSSRRTASARPPRHERDNVESRARVTAACSIQIGTRAGCVCGVRRWAPPEPSFLQFRLSRRTLSPLEAARPPYRSARTPLHQLHCTSAKMSNTCIPQTMQLQSNLHLNLGLEVAEGPAPEVRLVELLSAWAIENA